MVYCNTVRGSALVRDADHGRHKNGKLPHHHRQIVPYHAKLGDSMIKTRKEKREFGETTHKARKLKATSIANKHIHVDDSDDDFQPVVKKRRLASPGAVASTSKTSGRAKKVKGAASSQPQPGPCC